MTPGHRLLLLGLVAGAAGLLLVAGLRGPEPDRDNPCIQPLGWQVGSVDPRFGIPPAELESAVLDAVDAWENAAGRDLFRQDTAGLPIDLVYDQRQIDLERRMRRSAELEEAEADVIRLRSVLRSRADRLGRILERHNADVEAWNRARGGTESERVRLESERREIDRLRADVDRTGAALQDAIDRYNGILSRGDAGPLRVQAGNFEETIEEGRGRRVRTRARLAVYQFGSRNELVRVLAHELGHALGLGHVADPDALMNGEYSGGGPMEIREADLLALVTRCGPAWTPPPPP